MSRTEYLPPDPPGYESAVMVLAVAGIRLYAIGMPLLWLDEKTMIWREFGSLRDVEYQWEPK